MVSIAQNLRVKTDEVDVAKTELEKTQLAFKSYKEAKERDDANFKKLFADLKDKQVQLDNDVRELWEENDRLKKELENRPTEEDLLSRFRGSPAFYTEISEKACVVNLLECWFLLSYGEPEGAIDGFLMCNLVEKEKIFAEK